MRARLKIVVFLLFLSGLSAFAQTGSKVSYLPGIYGVDQTRPVYKMELSATLVPDGERASSGLSWRVFRETPNTDGKLPLVATAMGGSANLELNAGTYLVHAAFGRAGASKRIALSEGGVEDVFNLQAGGLQLNATSGDQKIDARDLRFSIYDIEQDEEGNRKLIALNVKAGNIVPLNEGTYHVLSRFGTINATVRADLQVVAGKLTSATLQHRGAKISLRLVSQSGGDPVANTAWAVFTEDGEKVFESTSVSPSVILAEGTYEAAVRNGSSDFRKAFVVQPGANSLVEVLLR